MGHPSAAEAFWAGEGGNAYIERNRIEWAKRVPFWGGVLRRTNPGLVLELGCNIGANLRAINACRMGVRMIGVDVNKDAVGEAQSHGLTALHGDIQQALRTYSPGTFDLTFTAGCLIHVPPAELDATMRGLMALSNRYVLAIEYAAKRPGVIEEVVYRGQAGLLWRADYGKLYEAMGLKLADQWNAGEGFDNCTAWLFEKP